MLSEFLPSALGISPRAACSCCSEDGCFSLFPNGSYLIKFLSRDFCSLLPNFEGIISFLKIHVKFMTYL